MLRWASKRLPLHTTFSLRVFLLCLRLARGSNFGSSLTYSATLSPFAKSSSHVSTAAFTLGSDRACSSAAATPSKALVSGSKCNASSIFRGLHLLLESTGHNSSPPFATRTLYRTASSSTSSFSCAKNTILTFGSNTCLALTLLYAGP